MTVTIASINNIKDNTTLSTVFSNTEVEKTDTEIFQKYYISDLYYFHQIVFILSST